MSLAERLAITVEETKSYLKVEHDEDDTLISDLIDVAIEQADTLMNNEFTEVDEDTGEETETTIPTSVKLACLKMVAAWYEHRGDQTVNVRLGDRSVTLGEVPWDARRLLRPYCRLPGL